MEELPEISLPKLRKQLTLTLVLSNIVIFMGPYIFLIFFMDFRFISPFRFSVIYWLNVLVIDLALVALYSVSIRPIKKFNTEWETTGDNIAEEYLEIHWKSLSRLPLRTGLVIAAIISSGMAALSYFFHYLEMIDLRQSFMGGLAGLFVGLVTGMFSFAALKGALAPAYARILSVKPFAWGGVRLKFSAKLVFLIFSVTILPLSIFSLQVERWSKEAIKDIYVDSIKADLKEHAAILMEHWIPSDPPPDFIKKSDKYFITVPSPEDEKAARVKISGWEMALPEYYTTPLTNGLYLARRVKRNEWMPYTRKLRNIAIVFFTLISVISVLVAIVFARLVSRPVVNMTRLTRQMAKGEAFRYKHLISYSDDEAGDLSMAFNDLLFVVQKQFGLMESLLERIREAVQVLGSSTAEMRAVADRQAEGAQAQAGRVNDLAGTSTEIAATAAQITNKTSSVKEAAESTLNACIEGVKRIETAAEQINRANKHADEMVKRMDRLENQFQKIEEVVGSIAEVSDRTELLSLNAALEAAGARKFGKRFGVVATEVKRLAGAIGQMTSEIYGHISSLRGAISETGNATRNSAKIIETGVDGVMRVKDDLDKLSETAEHSFSAAIEINVSTKEQTQATERLAETLQEISDLANNVAVGSEESRRAIEEINQLAIKFNDMLWSANK